MGEGGDQGRSLSVSTLDDLKWQSPILKQYDVKIIQ